MGKLLIIIAALIALSGPLLAQNPGPVFPVNAAPVGQCEQNVADLVGPGGTIYTCQNGTWGQVSGGGGGSVTSVVLAGTTNQIAVTGTCTITTTGTCTLSLPSGLVLPGTINGLTITTTTGTLTIATAKVLTVSNSLTLAGTDGVTLTFPTTSATIARTDSGQTFTGVQTFSSPPVMSGASITASTIPSGSVTYTSSLTGSTANTQQVENQSQCNVQNFGAVGDNSTDDGPNINKAFKVCFDVLFPEINPAGSTAIYKSTIPLMMRSGLTIHGGSGTPTSSANGVEINCTATSNCLTASFVPQGTVSSGPTVTGAVGTTCNMSFLGGGGGTAVATLVTINTLTGATLGTFSGGTYNPAPTSATSSSGTGTCTAGTATVLISAPGAGTRGITIRNLYVADGFGVSRSTTNGDGIYIDGGTDAAIFHIEDTQLVGFASAWNIKSTINSVILRSRCDSPKLNGLTQSLASTSLDLVGVYCSGAGQDGFNISNMVGGTWTFNSESTGRDGVYMDPAAPSNGITFHPEMEAIGRYGFYMNGQSNVVSGGSCYVSDQSVTVTTANSGANTNVTVTSGTLNASWAVGTNVYITTLAAKFPILTFTDSTHIILGPGNAGSHSGVTMYLGNHCFDINSVAQNTIEGTSTRDGDYGIAFNGGNSATFFAGQPIVSVLGAGNYTTGATNTALAPLWHVYDPNGVIQFPDVVYRCTAASTDTYTCALPWPIIAFAPGLPINVHFTNANTSATPTINFNGLGAVTMQKNAGALAPGDLAAGGEYTMTYFYNGAANTFQVLGLSSGALATVTNCASAASPAVCASAKAGSIAFPTGVTSVALTVNSTAVTANSQILVFPDDSLGARLSVTCNSTLATLVGGMAITGRTAGTSFTVTYNGTIATNPLCASFIIVN